MQFSDCTQPDVELRRAAVRGMANLCLGCVPAGSDGGVGALEGVNLAA